MSNNECFINEMYGKRMFVVRLFVLQPKLTCRYLTK